MKQKKTTPRPSTYERQVHDRSAQEQHTKDMKDVFDSLLDEMAKEMDRGFMDAGKTLAELFRAVATAAAKLPNLELHTDMITVCNDDSNLTVIFTPDEKKLPDLEDDEVDEEDEEEGQLYDAD